jgi:hypothetical protein
MLTLAQQETEPRDMVGELAIVTPIRLTPASAWWRPFPPRTFRAVVNGVGIVKVSAAKIPTMNPLREFVKAMTPTAVEKAFKPNSFPPVKLGYSVVGFAIAAVVLPWCGEPTHDLEVVKIPTLTVNGIGVADKLVAAQDESMLFVPFKKRSEKGFFRQLRQHFYGIAPNLSPFVVG